MELFRDFDLDLDLDLDLDTEWDEAEYFYAFYLPFLRNFRNAGFLIYLLLIFGS